MDCTICAGARFFVACATLIRGEDRNYSVLSSEPAAVISGQRAPRRVSQRTPWTASAQAHLAHLAEQLPIGAMATQAMPTRLLGFMALLSRYVRDHEAATKNLCRAWVPSLRKLLPPEHPLQLDLSATLDKQLPMAPQLLGKLIRELEQRTTKQPRTVRQSTVCVAE